MYTGPHIIKDGLVFGYDTGFPSVSSNPDTYKYNNGKPTTNLLTQNGASSLDVRTDIYANTTKTNLGGGKYRFVNDGTGGTTIRLYANVNDLVDGTTYGCSVSYQDFNPGDGTAIRLDWCDQNNTTFSLTNFGPANRIFMTGARSTYDNTFRFLDISLPINSSIVLFNAQVELETPSPFTDNTRSVTESLIDLKRTTDIDLSNVSFNLNAQMIFDGTDDVINTGIFSGRNPSTDPFTVEAIIKSDTTSGNRMWLDATNNGTNQRFYSALDDGGGNPLGIQGGGWSDSIPNTTDYIHQIVVMDGATARSYRNGVATYTKSYTSYTLPGPINIGGRNGYRWNGKIPLIRIYSRALSANEVAQNYNALKSRFSL